MSDLALARRLLAGDEPAFEDFFADYFPRLYRFARARLAGNDDAAEEVVQSALIKAIEKLHTYRGEAAIFTWLCTFCRREVATWLERAGKASEVSLIDDHPETRRVLDALAALTANDPESELRRRHLEESRGTAFGFSDAQAKLVYGRDELRSQVPGWHQLPCGGLSDGSGWRPLRGGPTQRDPASELLEAGRPGHSDVRVPQSAAHGVRRGPERPEPHQSWTGPGIHQQRNRRGDGLHRSIVPAAALSWTDHPVLTTPSRCGFNWKPGLCRCRHAILSRIVETHGIQDRPPLFLNQHRVA
jgi:RNA polymerase sigma factor (sigma-70 family)